MRTKRSVLCFFIYVVLFLSLATTLYAAPAPADINFYKGKLVTYIVATKPGGGYDLYARLLSKYLKKYLPGSTVIVKNIPGAGHIIGANETYFAKPNGLTIGTFNTGLIYAQILGQEGIKFDLEKFSWVGKASSETRVIIVGLKTPYKSIKDVIESKEIIKMATSGAGSQDYNETTILSVLLPAKFQLIPGYGGSETDMALLRGEVQGINGSYTGNLSLINTKEVRIVLKYGGEGKIPVLANVPHLSSLNISPKYNSFVALLNSISALGRLTAAPPGVPAGRLEVLRDAYKKAVNDPALLQEVKKVGLDIDPGYGSDVQKNIHDAIHQPEENLKLLKQIIKIQ
jgi:tripartite-type tricarboxylate transporter receptor subunit TctC